MSGSNQVILFEQEGACYLHRANDSSKIRIYLNNPNVWYILDGKKLDKVRAKTILICSPFKDHYKDFDKYFGAEIRYMPVWEWEEIETCRAIMHNHLKKSEVKQLFLKWGGIPRFVLEKARNQTQQSLLEKAISVCDEKIFNYIGESDSENDVSHKLIHIYTNPLIDSDDIEVEGGEGVEHVDEEPYTLQIMAFASDYVGEEITKKFKSLILDKLRTQFELSCIDYSCLGSCFKQMAHRILRNEGTFKVRSLESIKNKRSTQNVKNQNEILTFSNIQTIEDGKYYRPANKNFPSIDTIFAPDILFQMTTARNHPIDISGLKKLHSKLITTGEISFYFVVPAELYDHFQKQKFITTDSANVQKMPDWIKYRVKQYALRIYLSSESSSSGSSLKR
ncbi:15762_t:CDS:1, partial [Acaulospora morrowiae]